MSKTTQRRELSFDDILLIVNQYKWSILFITLLFGVLSMVFIYFKPAVYSSYSIVKVESDMKSKTGDLINNAQSHDSRKDVSEEISILQTYKMNKFALDKVDFEVQYFKKQQYRMVELYDDTTPIRIENIKILDQKILNKKIMIIPKKEGYSLQYIHTLKEKFLHKVFEVELYELDKETVYPYNQQITNRYFSFYLEKIESFDSEVIFLLHGNKRDIFELIIKPKLTIESLEKDTSFLKISFEDTLAIRAQRYVDALTNSFIEESLKAKNIQNSKTLEYIQEELANIKIELKNSESQLEKYQRSKSIVKASSQGKFVLQKLSDIEIKISENNLKTKLILNLINFVRDNYNLDAIAPSLSKLNDQSTLRLIEKLQDNQLLEEELEIEYTPQYPKLKSLKRQISSIRHKISSNLKSLRTNISYQNSNLLERKKKYEKELKSLPTQERQLVNIRRNYEVKSRMYEYLLKKEAENKLIQLAVFSDYQVVDKAYSNNIPLYSKRSIIIVLLGLFLGFLFAFLLSFIRANRNNKIESKKDITELTALPIYGTIPYTKQKKGEMEIYKQVKTPFSESFRTLRTNLEFLKKNKSSTTIVITSTIAGEGKTTVSANLATILEMVKYKTVVVNLDLRKPTLHQYFSVLNDKGVSSYLHGIHTIDDIILSTEFGNLDIIPSGPIPSDPSELILSKKLDSLIEYLQKSYDYIIIDSAPIGIVSDTKALMKYSDLTIMILRENSSKKEFIPLLEEMIEKYSFKNVGLVLNASQEKGGEYGYGYSYEYGT